MPLLCEHLGVSTLIILQGWPCYLSDKLYLHASAPSRIQVIGGGLKGWGRGGGSLPQADKSPSQTERRHSEGLGSPLSVLHCSAEPLSLLLLFSVNPFRRN